jgi:hypothetical protein
MVTLSLDEQETLISMNRIDKTAIIYTSDSKMKNRLAKLYPDKLTKTYKQDGDIVAVEYKVDPRLISFRKNLPPRRPLTDEERERRRKFMTELRAKQLAEKKAGV